MTWLRAGLAAALLLALPVSASFAQKPAVPQAPSATPRVSDEFGAEVQLAERVIVYFSGTGKWDTAFETAVDAFKTVYAFLEREGVKPAGDPMMIFMRSDDLGFDFQAAVPIVDTFKQTPQGDIAIGRSPSGKAYKFVHRGPYDAMENMYEAITNFFYEKNVDPKDIFIEEYATDPRTTPEDKLVINVLALVN